MGRSARLWDAVPGTAFCDAAFSRDGGMVASVQAETGLVEIRDVETGATLHVIDDFPACLGGGGRPHVCEAAKKYTSVLFRMFYE